MVVPRGGREVRYLHLADDDLISLVGSADARAFAVLYDRHARAAYWLAYRMTGGRQAAEDLTQDAFLKVWRSAGSYRPERGSVRTWILTIVHNRGIDWLRSAASRRRTQDRAEAEAVAARHEPSEAFEEAWRGSRRERVREALGTLPREQREAVTLAHLHCQTHTEIARRLGLPLGTVKGRMRLGLKKLGEHLGGGGVMTLPTIRDAFVRPSKGFQIGEEHLLNRRGLAPGSGGVPVEAQSFQPAALSQRLFEREELELRRTVLGSEQARVGHVFQPRFAAREGDVVAREGVPAVLDDQAPVPEPDGHLAASEPLLTVDAPMLQAGVAEHVEPPDDKVEKNARSRSPGWWRRSVSGPRTSDGLLLPSLRPSCALCLWTL